MEQCGLSGVAARLQISGSEFQRITILRHEEIEMNTHTQVTAVERVKACLKRIKEIEPTIQAWEFLDGDAALSAAAETDALRSGKPLHGWVFGIKDNHDTSDMPTGYGSPIYRGNRPAADASVVAVLRSNGAVVLGKTVSTEFAAWPPSRTRNPRNISHTPGGSSSGSAAAVAAGMVPVALGTQTLGSVIRPASYCGIVGFKPSYGRISRVGIRSLADSLDTVGIFANTVAEAAHVYAIAADQPEDVSIAASETPPRLRLCRQRRPPGDLRILDAAA
jgi:Asp-tRNA(Asn)/Glu-tRNA(Gln) amidotransferase A subunit family amidase